MLTVPRDRVLLILGRIGIGADLLADSVQGLTGFKLGAEQIVDAPLIAPAVIEGKTLSRRWRAG